MHAGFHRSARRPIQPRFSMSSCLVAIHHSVCARRGQICFMQRDLSRFCTRTTTYSILTLIAMSEKITLCHFSGPTSSCIAASSPGCCRHQESQTVSMSARSQHPSAINKAYLRSGCHSASRFEGAHACHRLRRKCSWVMKHALHPTSILRKSQVFSAHASVSCLTSTCVIYRGALDCAEGISVECNAA